MGSLGILEWTLILMIILLLFRAKRIPGVARTIGQSIREFRNAKSESDTVDNKEENI